MEWLPAAALIALLSLCCGGKVVMAALLGRRQRASASASADRLSREGPATALKQGRELHEPYRFC